MQCDALGRALSRSYGRYFAEFLEELSLVRLGLLDLTTCVGLRYGLYIFMLRGFSWKRAHPNPLWPKPLGFRFARSNAARIYLRSVLTTRTQIQ